MLIYKKTKIKVMDTKDKNERREEHLPDQNAELLKAEGKERKREHKHKMNKLWLWLGVLILIFILLYWIFVLGTAEDITGVTNG